MMAALALFLVFAGSQQRMGLLLDETKIETGQ
jgi:hypothetical protein